MLYGTELSAFCNVANSKSEWIKQIAILQKKGFTKKDVEDRSKIKELYNNNEEAKKIIEFIF